MSKCCEVCGEPIPSNRKKHCSSKCTKTKYLLENKQKVLLGNRKSHVKQTYGLSWDEYLNLYSESKGACMICKCSVIPMGDIVDHSKVARVDHCHTTGKIRGILCNECNKGLGAFKDNMVSLRNAIEYLENSIDDLEEAVE